MPIAVTLPTLANDPADTFLPQNSWVTILPTGGSALIFKIKTGSFSQSLTKVERKVAGSGGLVVKDRSVVTEIARTFKFTVDEFTEDLKTLANAAQTNGTARVWGRDPDDADEVAKMMTNEFSMSVSADGEFSLDPADFTSMSFTMEILGDFEYDFNASTDASP